MISPKPTSADDDLIHEIDIIAEYKEREEKMQNELMQKQQEIDKLQQENIQLMKSG